MATSPRSRGRAAAPSTASIPTGEIGVTGLRHSWGIVQEEFLRELDGERGRKIFAEMESNDATVGAILNAITLFLRAVKWKAEPAGDETADESFSEQAIAEAEFVDSLWGDMSHSWEDFVTEVLSMLTYGWHYAEIVWKRRDGPGQADPSKRSRYDDGRIGIRKIAPRSQDTLDRWEMQDDGGIDGMWQRPPDGMLGQTVFIPIWRSLLFRTRSRKNSPEGYSILRTAYRAWWFLKRIQEYEAIGIERDLAGLPVVKVPANILRSNASPADKAALSKFVNIARDLRMNHHAGVVIQSDPWRDADGKISNVPMVSIELLSSSGTRTIDTVEVKKGYQIDIARSVLAEFLMLGADSAGSWALSSDKTTFFTRAIEALLDQVGSPINRYALPRLWALNGLEPDLMPTMVPGNVAPRDIAVLGKFLSDVASAGGPLFPDDDLEAYIREQARLPKKSPEAKERQDADDELARTMREAAALSAAEGDQDPAGDDGDDGE